jgi:predicted transcriptional regulator
MICQLPNDIMELIIKNIPNCQDLINMKLSSVVLSQLITRFAIVKNMLSKNFKKFTKRRFCVNVCCYDDTEDIFTNVHNYYYRRYVHIWQPALNVAKVLINNKTYKINSHYCCECFKKNVLVGNNEKVSHNYRIPDQVNVTFCK